MSAISTDERVQRIRQLNLDPIKVKLMDAEEGKGWSREYVEAVDEQYRRFLILTVKYPENSIVPTKEIDEFWHAHILDTRKYAADCEYALGFFLHHFPYFGMRGEEDATNLADAFTETMELMMAEFGITEMPSATSAGCSFKDDEGAPQCSPSGCQDASAARNLDDTRPTLAAA